MPEKKQTRQDKEKHVLLGLVQLYITTGKPIGSNTLKENGFDHLSSATIRNYFAKLEKEGFLLQHHTSGGRVPTDIALKFYAMNTEVQSTISLEDQTFIEQLLEKETKEVSGYLMKTVEALSELSGCPALLLAPRFDQDFIKKVLLLPIDNQKALCAIVTDFGMVHTEILFTPKEFSQEEIKEIEAYFLDRLQGLMPRSLDPLLEQFALRSYNEVILRHVVHYTNFAEQDIYRTGFAKLLQYPEFSDISSLAGSLSLFENISALRALLKECYHQKKLHFWIGRDLTAYTMMETPASVIAVPYFIHGKVVGALAILGPQRMEYAHLFGLLNFFSNYLSDALTQSLYRHKISYRQPQTGILDLKTGGDNSYESTTRLLLETQTQ